ncbi:MAG TPA: sigma-70 family RNA polymerase sigma factor [Pyrinomonadaceae bacterium]|jgi:RNA polymerase sigma-70 factor (ECF subfamily)
METTGSNSVFAAAALEHIDALYGYAMTLTRDRTEAEDLVQETYLRAVRAANQPAADGNLKAWLFVIMRNTWLNVLRHKHNGQRIFEPENDEPGTANDTSSNPHVVYLRKLEQQQVREAIDELPDSYREIVVLRDIEGFSYQEIATVLNCPAGTVMSRLGRARGKLREVLSGRQTVHRLHRAHG